MKQEDFIPRERRRIFVSFRNMKSFFSLVLVSKYTGSVLCSCLRSTTVKSSKKEENGKVSSPDTAWWSLLAPRASSWHWTCTQHARNAQSPLSHRLWFVQWWASSARPWRTSWACFFVVRSRERAQMRTKDLRNAKNPTKIGYKCQKWPLKVDSQDVLAHSA